MGGKGNGYGLGATGIVSGAMPEVDLLRRERGRSDDE
jgi:hypothetical protein